MSAADPLEGVPLRDYVRGAVVTTWHDFASAQEKAQFLARVALEHAPRVRVLARMLGSLEQIHAFVRDAIAYEDETIERLETPSYVIHARRADCDGQAVLQAALVAALGGAAELVPLGGEPDDPKHLGVRVRPLAAGVVAPVVAAPWEPLGRSAPAGWTWAETTLAAGFGELPGAAARRLGTVRADVR